MITDVIIVFFFVFASLVVVVLYLTWFVYRNLPILIKLIGRLARGLINLIDVVPTKYLYYRPFLKYGRKRSIIFDQYYHPTSMRSVGPPVSLRISWIKIGRELDRCHHQKSGSRAIKTDRVPQLNRIVQRTLN